MHGLFDAAVLHLDPRRAHLLRVRAPLVAQRIEPRRQDERRRQAPELGRRSEERRRARVGLLRLGHVVLEVPVHAPRREEIPFREEAMGRQRARHIRGRIDEELEDRAHGVGAGRLRDDRGQVPPRAVSPDRDRARAPAERRRLRDRPARRRDRVLDPRREPLLRSEPIVDRDDDRVRLASERPADAVVRGDRPDDEAAAVEEDEHGARPAARARVVDPNGDPAARPGNRPVLGPRGDAAEVDDRDRQLGVPARALDADLGQIFGPQEIDEAEKELRLVTERSPVRHDDPLAQRAAEERRREGCEPMNDRPLHVRQGVERSRDAGERFDRGGRHSASIAPTGRDAPGSIRRARAGVIVLSRRRH